MMIAFQPEGPISNMGPMRLPYRPPVVVRPPVNIPVVKPPVYSAGGPGGPIRGILPEVNLNPPVAPVIPPSATTTNSGSSGFTTGCSTCDQRAQVAADFISTNWLWFAVGGVVILVLVLK